MSKLVSPKQLATAIGVSESSLKRWADDGMLLFTRTAGGHRRIPIEEAVRFIRSMGVEVVKPEAIGLSDAAGDRLNWRDTASVTAAFDEALEAGHASVVRSLVEQMYLHGWSVPSIIDGPMRTSLVRLGELYQHAEWGIVIEHRATDLCIQTINLLRHLLPRHRPEAPVAIGGAPEDDPYIIPSLSAAVTLSEVGYTDVNLGPRTPASVLINAVKHYKPRLVWLGCAHTVDTRRFTADVAAIAAAAQQTGARLVVGGRGCRGLQTKDRTGAVFVDSMGELAALARALCTPGELDPRSGQGPHQ